MTIDRRAWLAAAAGAMSAVTAKAAAPPPVSLSRGMNLWPWFSLTREFPAPRTDYDWPPFQTDRPVPRRDDLARLKAMGLDFVRLPVDPGPFLALSPERRTRLLDELIAAVTLLRSLGFAVVVNLQANAATHYWSHARMLAGFAAPLFPAYRGFVGLLAGRMQRLGPAKLALEPVNEPSHSCGAAEWDLMQDSLFAAARRESPDLTLVASGACGGMVSGLEPLMAAPLARFQPLLYTFHFYEPYLFSHQGAPWMTEPVYRALNNVPWPASAGSLERTLASVRARMAVDRGRSEAEKRAAYAETERVLKVYFDAEPDRRFIDKYMASVRRWCDREGVPPGQVLMGEFGALRTDKRYVAAPAPDRVRYIADVRTSAEANGFPWAFWNLFDGMGLMDDVTRRIDRDVAEALGLTAVP